MHGLVEHVRNLLPDSFLWVWTLVWLTLLIMLVSVLPRRVFSWLRSSAARVVVWPMVTSYLLAIPALPMATVLKHPHGSRMLADAWFWPMAALMHFGWAALGMMGAAVSVHRAATRAGRAPV